MVIAARICLYWDTDWVVGRVNFGVYWVQKHYKRLIVIASIQRGSEETTLRERERERERVELSCHELTFRLLVTLAGLLLIDVFRSEVVIHSNTTLHCIALVKAH